MQMPSDIFGTVSLKRYAAGSYNATTGKWAEGAESSVTIRASIQPASGREMIHLEEGERTKAAIVVRTPDLIKTLDEKVGTRSDRVAWAGEYWEVHSVEFWSSTPELSHYKAVAVREQK